MSDEFTPRPEHHFTFGLWTVGNPGKDPFGHEWSISTTKEQLTPEEMNRRGAEVMKQMGTKP